MEVLFLPALIIGGFIFYFLPALVANKRKHKSKNSIFLANLFFGWTLVGWAICAIWSASGNVENVPAA